MKSRTSFIGMIVFLVVLNVILLLRAYQYAAHYPLDSLPLGTHLQFPVAMNSDTGLNRIAAVNGIDSPAAAEIISHICSGAVSFVIESKRGLVHVPERNDFNRNVFLFFLFIVICADIHCIWGIIVNRVFRTHNSALFFGNYSFATGLLFFGLIIYLLFYNTVIPVSAGSAMLSWMIFRAVLFQIKQGETAKKMKLAFIPILAAVILAEFIFNSTAALFVSFMLPVISLVFMLGSIFFRLDSDRQMSRSIVVLFIVACLFSAVMPLVLIAISIYYVVFVPITVFVFLSLIFPFIMANNVLSENLYMFFSVRKRYFLWIMIDLLIAILGGLTLFVSWEVGRGSNPFLPGTAAFFIIISLLETRRHFYKKLQMGRPIYKGVFADSLRKISEISVSPGNFRSKLEQIAKIVKDATGAGYFKIELFELSIINQIPGLDGVVEYSRGTRLENYFMRYPSLIYRHSLFTGWIFDLLEIEYHSVDLIIPVKSERFCIGAMYTGQKEKGRPFADDEMLFFSSLTSLLYQMIENEILFSEYIIKREYEREIDIASYIQMRLIPKYLPYKNVISAYLYSRPLLKVTGDYYNFIQIDDDRVLVAIGDVAGHGLSAATILATAGNMIYALVEDGRGINYIMNELNSFFSVRYRGTELMTLILILFDRRDHKVEYCNAGHCMPVVCRDGAIVEGMLSGRNPILGADRAIEFISSVEYLKQDDEIILYTDGIIEIQIDKQGNNSGEDLVTEIIVMTKNSDVEKKIEMFTQKIASFAKSSIHDDITMIGIKVH